MAKLSADQAKRRMADVPGWRRVAGEMPSIRKQYELDAFVSALKFVNKVGRLAEAANHHPDITINYNKVTLLLTTHDAGGLTEKDFNLARQIDESTKRR